MKLNLKAIKGSIGEYGRVRRGTILKNLSEDRAKKLIAGGAYAVASDDDLKAAGKTKVIDGLAPVKADTSAKVVDLTKLKIDQLKAFAKERDIELGDAKKRDDIIATINLALAAPESDDVNLGDLSDDDLKAFAAEKGIDLGDATERDQIVAKIEEALTAPDA